ncbi:MAG: hypothetical protein FWC19_09055, partial [Treponema sp.]|nr:hypothetical protein [Treponema sp.]
FLDTSKAHVYFHEFAYERCIIRNNYFENHSVLSSDASPVYTGTSGTDAGGTEIYHNFIVCGDKGDNGTLTHLRDGLYIDNNNSNFIVRHNIVIGGHSGLRINIPNDGTRFHNNTVIGAHYGIGFYTNTLHKADASRVTVLDNLFVNIKSHNISYWGTENGKSVNYNGDFVNGTIPVTVRTEGRMQSSGNARGTVDAQYRPTGRTPDIGAIPRNGQMFAYGADWKLGERK